MIIVSYVAPSTVLSYVVSFLYHLLFFPGEKIGFYLL